MKRPVLLTLAIAVAIGGVFGGLVLTGAFGQGESSSKEQVAAKTPEARETAVQAMGEAIPTAPKEPITVVTSCPDQNSLHPKTGIWPIDPHHGSPDKAFRHKENAATTFASNGLAYTIWAGATNDDPDQGALMVEVIHTDPCAVVAGLVRLYPPPIYQTPVKGGPVTLTAIDGDTVVFLAADGIVGRLDFLAGTFH